MSDEINNLFRSVLEEYLDLDMRDDLTNIHKFADMLKEVAHGVFRMSLSLGIKITVNRWITKYLEIDDVDLITAELTRRLNIKLSYLEPQWEIWQGPRPVVVWNPPVAGQRNQQREQQHDQQQHQQREQQQDQQWDQPPQLPDETGPYVNAFLTKQQTEMKDRQPPLHVPPDVRIQFYSQVMGELYRDTVIFDMITQSEQTLGEYLDDSPDNLFFYISDKQYFTTNRRQIVRSLPLYECAEPKMSNKYTHNVYINLSNLGCPCIGVANYDAFKMLVVNSNYQIFALRDERRKTGTLASYKVRHAYGSYVGDAHCQPGSESNYYSLFIPSHSV